ncbi:MAG: magnesium transporter [Actinomycetaceae bacterium]|nr:magnesium transporter [Actinomycetaceae bacterium]
MSSLIYVARLAGTPVFDPIGDRIGYVHDVVVLFRLKGNPIAVGLVVEVVGKRRIFIPLTRVTSIARGQVIITGLVNFRRFSQRSSETLVTSQILGRTITIKDTNEKAQVIDAAFERVRGREWRLTTLYVNIETKNKNKKRSLALPIQKTRGLETAIYSQGADSLVSQLSIMKPADVAEVFRDLPEDRKQAVAQGMSDNHLADLLEELSEEDSVEIVSMLDNRRAAAVLDEMAPDDAADLVAELPTTHAAHLLDMMEPEEAKDIRRLLKYEDRTAGGMMTTEPIVLAPDATVAEALAAARRADIPPALAAIIFVCRPPLETPTGKFIGVAHIQRLLREPPSTMIGAIIDSDVESVLPNSGIGMVTRLLATYDLTALPVVDADEALLGAISVDDVLDHLLPEDWRDTEVDVIDEVMEAQHG